WVRTTPSQHHQQLLLFVINNFSGSGSPSTISFFVNKLFVFIILDQNKKAKNTLPGNSNLFEWTWPGEGPMEGYILGREIPNIGEWMNFSLANLQKKQIEIPRPMVSTHTIPEN